MAIKLQKKFNLLKMAFLAAIAALGMTAVTAGLLADQTEESLDVEVEVWADGKPAEGATVWMEERSGQTDHWKTIRTVGPLTTPKSGTIRLELKSGADNYAVFAKNKQGELAMGTCFPKEKKNKKSLAGKSRITLTLQKTTQVKGQLFFGGKPVADADCKLKIVWCRMELESNDLEQILGTQFSQEIAGRPLAVKTDHEGRFVLDGIPQVTEAGVVIEKEGIGLGFVGIPAGKSIEADLERGGKLEISIEGETKPTTLKGIYLQFASAPARTTPLGRKLIAMTSGTSLHSADFTVPGIAGHEKGTYQLSTQFDPALPYHFGAPQEVTIEPEKTTKVVLKKVPVAKCSGRIVHAKTGKGIPNMAFRLEGIVKSMGGTFANASRRFTESYAGETDAEGNYAIVCRGNHDYTLTFGGMNNQTDYELPQWDHDRKTYTPAMPHLTVADGESARFPEIALIPSRVVTGIVKDDSGKPVEGPYEVHCMTRHTQDQKPPQFEKSQFTLSQLKPDIPLKFYIRKGKAVNIAKVFSLEQLDSPLAFTISEKNQVTCAGRIVDAKGKPVSKAKVSLVWLCDYQPAITPDGRYMGSGVKIIETLDTDDQGRFAASGLWPRERFYVRVNAKGYKPWVPKDEGFEGTHSAIGGGTIDFGDIALTEEVPLKEWSPFRR